MKFTAFRIKNFKGIIDTTLELNERGASIHTLVGLNESGKTTLLEAINSFRPDVDGMHAIAQGDTSTPNKEQFIPKSKRADFTGTIEIIATVRASEDERRAVSDFARSNLQAQVQQDSIPEVFTIRKYFKFENSKFTREGSTWALGLQAKLKGKRTFSNLGSETEEWREIVKFIQGRLPRIIYFPNFLFHFPDKILISGAVENGVEAREKANEYFVRVIQDAMASLRPPLDLHKHIVERVLEKNKGDPFSSFMQVWFGSPDSENVEAVQERLAEQITKEVFGRWKQVLGREIEDTQIEVKNQIEYNETKSEREVYLTFRVKQGSHRYNISERSLGFRWFFCFLLFTRFSGASNAEKSVVFLLDEPASNLHSKAQAKLLDSFEVITGENNALIYSTHSHHLINPLWLETAHVVSSGVDLDADMEGSMTSVSGGISIEVTPYRRFVGQSAEKSHFFSPFSTGLNTHHRSLRQLGLG